MNENVFLFKRQLLKADSMLKNCRFCYFSKCGFDTCVTYIRNGKIPTCLGSERKIAKMLFL